MLCGCALSDEPRPAGGPIPLVSFEDEYVAKLCSLYFSCSGLAGDLTRYVHDEAHCRQHISLDSIGYTRLTTQDLHRAQNGELTYDASEARACVDSMDCQIGSWLPRTTACDRVLRGGAQLGDACSRTHDCEGKDVVCGPGGTVCGGICQAAPEIGERCGGGGCTTREGTISSICTPQDVCAEYEERTVAEGEPCGAAVGGSLLTRSICESGTICQRSENGDATVCVRMPTLGEACNAVPCVTPYQCSGSHICEASTIQRVGDPCDGPGYWGLSGRHCNRYDGLQCNSQSTCEPYSGSAEAGESCGLADYQRPCVDTAYCDQGRCYAKSANGGYCNNPTSCLSGYCDPVADVCASRPACS